MRKIFSPKQKAQIALEAHKGLKTTNQIGSEYEAHPTQVGIWKKQLLDHYCDIFSDKRNPDNKSKDDLIDRLYKIVGQRDIELDWLKKNYTLNHKERVQLIERKHPDISIKRQAELLDIGRQGIYYIPKINEEDIRIMHIMDKLFTEWPVYGTRRFQADLKDYNFFIGRPRVKRLMNVMGIEAIYPKKRRNTSLSDKQHKKYPYLLRDLQILYPNHVWGTDITYIPLEHGFCYLTAILDWFSRYVVAWELSNSLDTSFCISALEDAFKIAIPEIHNSDQGVQYTSLDYTGKLEEQNISISVDGRGRCFDNIFTERLWCTVKYDDIYIKGYRTISEVCDGLASYFPRYNMRKHQSLDYRRPEDVYFMR